jgi:predicted transcriptional regulator
MATQYRPQAKLSINVPEALGDRLRTFAFAHRLSGSSIIQVALEEFFARGDDIALAILLRESGASLRRR